ncbi:MAG: SpoIIE family protein phosphatase [Flavobacteriales bacterium]|nr:SpoIIE family protein phosphatase [Flavobacteriales bacterium]
MSQEITGIEISLLKAINRQEMFYNFELSNTLYFETGKSLYLEEFQFFFKELKQTTKILSQKELDEQSIYQIGEIIELLNEFESLFSQVVLAIKKRGFKNYGIEGEMRKAIHKLEDLEEINLAEVLMLRRHEKDFIIRHDPIYIVAHDKAGKQLISSIQQNTKIKQARKEEVLITLNDYLSLFDEIVLFERIIGLKSNTGLKRKITRTSNDLQDRLNQLELHNLVYQKNLLLKLNFSIGIFWAIYLFLSISASLFVSKRFTKRLNTLSGRINYFVNTNFSTRLELVPQKAEDEVGQLWNNFIKMEQEIVDYINLFKEKVDEKTIELLHKTEKIEIQKKELTYQKEESEKKTKDLLDSMRYAWRIQQALIPTVKRFQKNIGQGFVYFVPKEIVSGDIYWTYSSSKKQNKEQVFSTIDCTGHGVPGAFMSILAVSAINFAVLNKGHKEPAKVLQATNNYVFNTLKYYNGDSNSYTTKDGMDMLFYKLNRDKSQLEYAGANRPLYIVRKYTGRASESIGLKAETYKLNVFPDALVFEVKATKKSVGVLDKKQSSAYVNHEIKVEKGDMLYLTSDGFADQFGGIKNKKFMVNRLKNLLVLIHELDEVEQKAAIRQTIEEWKGKEEQVDDITIMGVKV